MNRDAFSAGPSQQRIDYAPDPKILAASRAAGLSIKRIGAVLNYNLQNFAPRAAQVARGSV